MDIGTFWERALDKAFTELKQELAVYHRFPDTKAARNTLPAQPADFLFRQRGGETWLVEAKASDIHASLRNCFGMVEAKQIGHAKLWRLSEAPASFWFFSEPENRIEVWMADQVIHARSTGTPLKSPDHAFDFNLKDLIDQVRKILL